jgi:hypothetical protein
MIAVLVSIMYFGCSPSSDTGGPDINPYDRSTPENLLKFFAEAYKQKDKIHYDESLDFYFRFKFTADIAKDLELDPEEPWWGKTEDLISTGGMFDEPTVTDIDFDYQYQIPWYPCEEYRTTPEGDTLTLGGRCCRLDPDIKVTTEVPSNEDPLLIYHVNGSWLDIAVVPDRDIEGLWTIIKIEEFLKNPGD